MTIPARTHPPSPSSTITYLCGNIGPGPAMTIQVAGIDIVRTLNLEGKREEGWYGYLGKVTTSKV